MLFSSLSYTPVALSAVHRRYGEECAPGSTNARSSTGSPR